MLPSLLLWGAIASAEQPITYHETLAAAEEANVELAGARLALLQAEGSLLAARGTFDPSLTSTGFWSREFSLGFFESDTRRSGVSSGVAGFAPSGTTYSLSGSFNRTNSVYALSGQDSTQDLYSLGVDVSLTQELLKGHKMAYNLQNVTMAREAATVAELTVEKLRQDVLGEAAQAYWGWSYQVELHRIAQESVRVAEEAERVGRLRVEAGDLAPVESTRLEAALAEARANELEAGDAARQAADTVLLVTGRQPGQAILPATPPGNAPPALSLDLDAAIGVALAQNVDLAIVRAQLDAASSDLSLARHAVLPSLSATAGAGLTTYEDTLGDAAGGFATGAGQPNLSIVGEFSYPLGNRAARGDRDRTVAALHGARLDVEALERSLQMQVRQQARSLASSNRRIELADLQLRLAKETLEAEEALSDAGRAIQKDVLEARAEVERTKTEVAKARTDYRLAQVELMRLQGQLTKNAP